MAAEKPPALAATAVVKVLRTLHERTDAMSPKANQQSQRAAQQAEAISAQVHNFQRAPHNLQIRFAERMQSQWPLKAKVSRMEASEVLKMAKSMLSESKKNKEPLARICSASFVDTADPLKRGRLGLAKVFEVVLGFANVIIRVFRPVLKEFDFPQTLEGYATMDALISFWFLVAKNTEVGKVMIEMWRTLFFGSDPTYLTKQEQLAAGVMLSNMTTSAVPLITTSQSYLQHLALPPLERRKRSSARTMALVEALLCQMLGPPKDGKRTMWVLGASSGVEGQMARDGCFEDAAAFVEEREMEIFLIGDDLPSQKVWPQGKHVKVFAHTWQELHAGGLPDPDFVFCFNTGLGTLEPQVVELWLPRLVDILLYPPGSTIGLVLTCRCEAELQGERALLKRLGARIMLPTAEREHLRNVYSGMAGNLYSEYDDNGWLLPLSGSSKKKEELLELANDPKGLCDLVAEDMKAAKEKLAAAEAPSKSDDADAKSAKQPAVFWGILDLKHDPALGIADHVKVLETGDGRASKFSGYGAAIKESFQQESKLEGAVHRAVLVESKKLTWDMVCERGYAHIQPRQGCFPKAYTPDLAQQIGDLLSLKGDDICILKLANRARGAGVIPIHFTELDEALRILLQPPPKVEKWLKQRDAEWVHSVSWGCFEEQVRHWWSNEYPAFLVEDFCQSRPVTLVDGDGSLELDGTMRVGFSLHRDAPETLPDGYVFSESGIIRISDSGEEPLELNSSTGSSNLMTAFWNSLRPLSNLFPVGPEVLRIQWLGGYWKLPMQDMNSPDLRGRIVSVAKLGTAPVAAADLHEVYAALGDVVPLIFSARHEISHTSLLKRYSDFPELGSAVAARLSCSMRSRDRAKALNVLQLAKTKLEKLQGQACDVVNSYILRNLGVHEAISNRWSEAEPYFRQSVRAMPTNANSRYLLGMCSLEKGDREDAIRTMEGSLQLDPDFKAPYVGIAVASLRLGWYEKAAEVSQAANKRFPQTVHILYNLGAAKFALACNKQDQAEAAELRKQALDALTAAQELAPSSAWTERDDRMLAYLKEDEHQKPWPTSELPRDGWRFYGWRP